MLIAISKLVGKIKKTDKKRGKSETNLRSKSSRANNSIETTKDTSKRKKLLNLQDSSIRQVKSFHSVKNCYRKLRCIRTGEETFKSPFLSTLASNRNNQGFTYTSQNMIDVQQLIKELESKDTKSLYSKKTDKRFKGLTQKLISKSQGRQTYSKESIRINNKGIRSLIEKIKRRENTKIMNTCKSIKLSFEQLRSIKTETDVRSSEVHTERNLKEELQALKKRIEKIVKHSADKDKEIELLKERLNLI